MVDYHMHLENGPLTVEWIRKFWDQARMRGISEIGITEHCHKFREFAPLFRHLQEGPEAYSYMREWLSHDFQGSLAEYVGVLQEARASGIPLKIGLEADFFPGKERLLHDLLSAHPFDFVLGSVHTVGMWGFDYSADCGWDGRDVNQAYHDYYELLSLAAASGLFDILSHFDVIKVFGYQPSESMEADVEAVLKAVQGSGVCIEVSTAGLRKPVKEMYPAEWILAKAAERQIPITFASDAHYPEEVGQDWEKAIIAARRCGYREYRVFAGRESYAQKIPK